MFEKEPLLHILAFKTENVKGLIDKFADRQTDRQTS